MKRRGDDWWTVWAIIIFSPFILMGIVVFYTPILSIAEKLPSFLGIALLVIPLWILAIGINVYRTHKK